MHKKQPSLFNNSNSLTEENLTFPTHEGVVKIISMTEKETENQFKNLTISYSFAEHIFGNIIVASTSQGVCYLAFYDDDKTKAVEQLKKRYKNAVFVSQIDEFQKNALLMFYKNNWQNLDKIVLHIKGTEFQMKVWKQLLRIPFGSLINYQDIAQEMGNINSARAIGTAVGKNPVGFIIPCHRVVPLSGKIGGYMWGVERKATIIEWERSLIN